MPSTNENARSRFPLVGADQVGAFLYHGTSVANAALILAEDRMVGVEDDEGPEFAGVSLTGSLPRARGYALGTTGLLVADFADGAYPDAAGLDTRHAGTRDHDRGAVLVLDARSVVDGHEVRAVAWQDSGPPEERVVGDVDGVGRHLVAVIVDPLAVEEWAGRYEANAALPVERFAGGFFRDPPERIRAGAEKAAAALRAMAAHPKVVAGTGVLPPGVEELVVAACREAEAVILSGPRAAGAVGPDSGCDVLVVLPGDGDRAPEEVADRLRGRSFPVLRRAGIGLTVATLEEIAADPSGAAHAAYLDGVVLYGGRREMPSSAPAFR